MIDLQDFYYAYCKLRHVKHVMLGFNYACDFVQGKPMKGWL
jgi:hypothetical protein